MSELNVYHHELRHNEYDEFYLKYEADKVIAELEESHKKEVEQLLILNREQANGANRLRDSMEQVIHRQKYKRCMAMARWCRTSAQCDKVLGVFKYRDWYRKWSKRWLELAKKFKEAK
mgnify:CR=1 FL=1